MTLGANGARAYLGGDRARVDPQAGWRSCHMRAADASKSSWADYIDWKQSQHVEICTKTGAILSITFDLSKAGNLWEQPAQELDTQEATPGISLEHARALGAYGFSDLKYAMSFQRHVSSSLSNR